MPTTLSQEGKLDDVAIRPCCSAIRIRASIPGPAVPPPSSLDGLNQWTFLLFPRPSKEKQSCPILAAGRCGVRLFVRVHAAAAAFTDKSKSREEWQTDDLTSRDVALRRMGMWDIRGEKSNNADDQGD